MVVMSAVQGNVTVPGRCVYDVPSAAEKAGTDECNSCTALANNREVTVQGRPSKSVQLKEIEF